MAFKSDIEIAQENELAKITEIAKKIGIGEDHLELYGNYKAKISADIWEKIKDNKDGKLILVTAITPTPAGEGKTTTTVGLADGMNLIGEKVMVALREPSLGPVFGMKGGAAGGGYAQIVPMEDINLHFTGDMHAIGAANNLLAAMIDNHIHQGNLLGIDPRRIQWKRCVDMKAEEINAQGAVAALLKDAVKPNLVQTLEETPAFVHGGPFANIAHGCNSVIATKTALKLADYVITEAGFAADLGAEKFFDIKCRQAELKPDAVVVVATVRALKNHGGVAKEQLNGENIDALKKGMPNLIQHIENIQNVYKLPCVVAINAFPTDTKAELETVRRECDKIGVNVELSNVWAEGGKGGKKLAKEVVRLCKKAGDFSFAYEEDDSIKSKVEAVAKRVYRADGVSFTDVAAREIEQLEKMGYGNLPICIAKTQYSFSDNPELKGAPRDFEITVKKVKLSAGAGFVVVYTGDIMTMPGLPKKPAAESIDVDKKGKIIGLF